MEEYEKAFVVKNILSWLSDLESPGGERWLSSTVAGNKAMMHTLVMDLQKIIHACFSPFLTNTITSVYLPNL